MEFPGEKWKVIPDFPMYDISSYGRVFSHHWKRFLNPIETPVSGYAVTLWNSEGRKTRYVHRLVFQNFGPQIKGRTRKKIYHIDRDKSNNHISNLTLTNSRLLERKA